MNFLANLAQGFGSIESQLEANLSFEPSEINPSDIQEKKRPEIFMPLKNSNGTLFDSSTKLPVRFESGASEARPNSNIRWFKLPIQYLDKTHIHVLPDLHVLPEIVATDLELSVSESSDSDSDNKSPQKNMYDYLLNPTTSFSKEVLPQWKTHFTTDISFLVQTQEVILTIPTIVSEFEKESELEKESEEQLNIQDIWKDIQENESFLEKYGYIEWAILADWNLSAPFLQCMSICNILSPLMSFFIPIFILVIPFFLLKFQGIPITISLYIECLTNIAKNHFIGKAILSFQNFSFQSLFYLLGSLGLYLLQMYQNTMQCIRFYRNTQYMNNSLCFIKKYIDTSILKMNAFCEKNKHLDRYSGFCNDVLLHKKQLENIKSELYAICPFECSLYKTTEIGYMMKCFYRLYTNTEYNAAILYSMGFEGYLQQLTALQSAYSLGYLGLATFDTEKEIVDIPLDSDTEDAEGAEDDDKPEKIQQPKRFILDQAYPPHLFSTAGTAGTEESTNNCVKNTANLDNKIIITGPNASGKTTFLKTTAINLILSQQFGMGCYRACHFKPYTHFHSYLNIPDTSGRDSLFQAESRRCKEILDIIKNTNSFHHRHFCIFDELYSGTNPKEATKSAYAFLKYISETYENVDYILTTHYVNICEKLEKNNCHIRNYRMAVIPDKEREDKFVFTYLLEPGISNTEGAIQILENMEYPEDMLNTIRKEVF